MDFGFIVFFAIMAWGVYSLFALFVHRKERLRIIDKMDFSNSSNNDINLSMYIGRGRKFTGLRIGLLLIGIGLGLLVGFFIVTSNFDRIKGMGNEGMATVIIFGACILLLGGAGLLAAYLIENRSDKKK